jgi:catechol 2,3-dioxygenase-like lactoylglutathione lyase family enzyme
MLDHVILTVKDFERSVAFYRKALKPLGLSEFTNYQTGHGHPDLKGFGKDGRFIFWLKEGKPDPSAVHVGFVDKSQAVVKAFHRAAIAAGGREKTENYFATWVLDPDEHDIEVVNKTGQID